MSKKIVFNQLCAFGPFLYQFIIPQNQAKSIGLSLTNSIEIGASAHNVRILFGAACTAGYGYYDSKLYTSDNFKFTLLSNLYLKVNF